MREESLFVAALDLPTPAGRAAFLDRECGGDAGLRARVARLLAADDRSTGILDAAADTDGPAANPYRPGPGLAAGHEVAGRFRLVRKLGEGGMGEVWEADQAAPVRRPVALKVIRPGFDPAALLARFDQERQALALMDHPNIAKVFDAGVADGLPFLAMELVDGAPLTRYCDARRLDVRGRLGLFVPVCRAVQHAHQKGVIHRDLKPSNVLVAEADGKPVPKVIDFGIAKAAGAKLTDRTVRTGYGAILGTPEYMAPEQAAGEADVDTRADVYALGVVLYELLTGTTPVRRTEGGGLLDLLRAIREDEPPTPSRRLKELRNAECGMKSGLLGIRNPQSAVRSPQSQELDWVVMRCLEKDRARRYESAAALARDVERFLADEVVEARPPTAGYRVRKFVRRNRAAVTAAGLVLLALVGGVVGTSWGLVRATDAERVARDNERQAIRDRDAKEEARRAEEDQRRLAVAERDRADEERAVTREVNDILMRGLPGQAGPSAQARAGKAPNPDLKVRTLLDGVAARLDGRPDDPAAARAEAIARRTVGLAYVELGLYPEAVRNLERALALARGLHTPDSVAAVAADLAVAYRRAGELGKADRLNREFLEAAERDHGPDHEAALRFGYNLAVVATDLRRLDEAERLFARAVAGRERAFGADTYPVAEAVNGLGRVYAAKGDFGRALDHYSRALAVYRRELSDDAPDTMIVRNNVAAALASLGRTAEAVAVYEPLVAAARRLLPPAHVDTLTYVNGLARCYHDQRRYDLAEPLQREAAETARATLPDGHPDAIAYALDLGRLYEALRRYPDADRELSDALRLGRRTFPAGHPQTVRIVQTLTDVRFAAGRPADAEPLVRELLAHYEGRQPDHWITAYVRGLLGRAALEQGRYAEAEPHLRAGYQGLTERLATIPPAWRVKRVEVMDRLAEVYDKLGRPEEVARWRTERAKYPFVAPPPRPVR
ncbi:MAG: serine/threonine-protein kinase [Gemmataceae bacterium]|nr:serine/threonine-protein kinase [Gemmataceae bacterium]